MLDLVDGLTGAERDRLESGVIGSDPGGTVRRYDALESRMTGLHPDRVIGQRLFTRIAQCMNGFLVAQRFDDAAAASRRAWCPTDARTAASRPR